MLESWSRNDKIGLGTFIVAIVAILVTIVIGITALVVPEIRCFLLNDCVKQQAEERKKKEEQEVKQREIKEAQMKAEKERAEKKAKAVQEEKEKAEEEIKRKDAEREAAEQMALENQIAKEKAERDAKIALDKEVARRKEAERNALDAKEIAAMERAKREGTVFWKMAIIRNRTKANIGYSIFESNNTWSTHTLEPGKAYIYWRRNMDITIKYDYSFAPGAQLKTMNAKPTVILGHEPSEQEKKTARLNYFGIDGKGEIGLYIE